MTTTYSLRVREDGQTEVLEHSAVVIGTFPRAEHARHFYDWMAGSHLTVRKADEPLVERPSPVKEAVPREEREQHAERDEASAALPPVAEDRPVENRPALPAVVEADKPRLAVIMCADLPAEVMDPAFERLERGEKLQAVAADLGVPWPSLRGAYAGYKGRRQREIARSGMSTCSLCSKEFMPSVTSPDTCARCTRTMER